IVDMDGSVGDASRICRVAGTYNVKGDAYTYLISSSGVLYTLKKICDSFDIDLEEAKAMVAESKDKPRKTAKKKSNQKKAVRRLHLTIDRTPIEEYENGSIDVRCFGKDRFTKIDYLQTLDRLFELRPDWTHKRDIFAHIYYNLLLPVRGKAESDVIIRKVYNMLCEKSDDIDVFSAEELEHIRSTFYDGLGGTTIYNYLKFETIADKLDISNEEIEEIGKAGYFERRHRKMKARANNILRDKMRNLCKHYRLKGYTQKGVADLVNRDMGFKTGEKGACNVDFVRRYTAGINRKSNAEEIDLEEHTAYVRKIVPAEEHKLRKISTISYKKKDDVGGLKEKNDLHEPNSLSMEDNSIEKLIEEFSKGNNLTVLGAGGTGKSFFISKAKQYCKESKKSYKTISFTGIAAENVDGITIHKALNLQSDKTGKVFRHDDEPSFINASFFLDADVIFIDEIGFIRSDLGLFLIKSIHVAEELTGHRIQLVWTGDFLQLPPVCKVDESIALTEDGFSSLFLFSLSEWTAVSGNIVNLRKNYRTTDNEYLDYLEKIRIGKCDTSDIEWFNSNLDKIEDQDAVFIAGKRRTVQKINQAQISRLFKDEELKEYIISEDRRDRCKFAVGMKVMITKNYGKNYQNGSRGIIIRMSRKSVTVKLDVSGKKIRVKISGGWLPLTPCYAMTAHKAQGQTFNSINLVAEYGNGSEFFAPGQLYTVLSRVHDRSGVHLIGKLCLDDVIVDKEAFAFQYGTAS
ncbi:MAG: ATP-dependent RecD-like DNA helicase, partial [Lachnospiraceae bacterium]|nr:ATP-dependent RecD-like DNA helicase [Lachnospiraceae bacterium]